jgi:hypothetical protein
MSGNVCGSMADMDAGQKLQALYDAEVNFAIETFWDAGFKAKLGDALNGFVAERECRTLAEAADWLLSEADARYGKVEKP